MNIDPNIFKILIIGGLFAFIFLIINFQIIIAAVVLIVVIVSYLLWKKQTA